MTGPVSCPICRSGDLTDHFQDLSPIVPTIAAADDPADAFADIVFCECKACGHFFNRTFDPALVDRMYGSVKLTNLPVHPSMNQRLNDLAQWFPSRTLAGTHVVEIGAGGGHFARLVAEQAKTVTLFEPCRALTRDMLPESNIQLVNALYTPGMLEDPVDTVICRQVLEHCVDIEAMLGSLVTALKPDGQIYIEVPNLDYILDWQAVLDIHVQHVQYFSIASLCDLAARVGLAPIKLIFIKDQHDFGILFGRRGMADHVPLTLPDRRQASNLDLGSRLAAERQRLAHILDGSKAVALYGATFVTTRFFSLLTGFGNISVCLDDNPGNFGDDLFTPLARVPIVAPSPEQLNGIDCVLIGAYLHDLAIAGRLRAMGYRGRLISLRPTPMPANEFGLVRGPTA